MSGKRKGERYRAKRAGQKSKKIEVFYHVKARENRVTPEVKKTQEREGSCVTLKRESRQDKERAFSHDRRGTIKNQSRRTNPGGGGQKESAKIKWLCEKEKLKSLEEKLADEKKTRLRGEEYITATSSENPGNLKRVTHLSA